MSVRSPWRSTPFVGRDGVLTPESFDLLQSFVNVLNGVEVGAYTQIVLAGVTLTFGSGSPNGAVSGSPPDLYFNLSGGAGTTLWVKETGSATNTGWVGK